MDNECKARCVGMDCKRRRRMMAKLRGGTAELENVQMQAARICLGVGRRHPLISVEFEMDMLSVKWEVLRRGIEF